MKKTLLISGFAGLLCMPFLSMSQSRNKSVTEVNIANEKSLHETTSYSLFSNSTLHDNVIDNEIRNVTYLTLNKQQLSLLMQKKSALISVKLPSGESFTLTNYNILDAGCKVYEVGADGVKRPVEVEMGEFYRGIIESSDLSLAAFTFQKEELAAVFSTKEGGNYNLVLNYHNPGVNRDQYILFKQSDVINGSRPKCAVVDAADGKVITDDNTAGKNVFNSCHKLRVSLQGDNRLYQRAGNNMTTATTYLTTLFNTDAVLFNNEGINAVVSEIVVSTVAQGYTYGSSGDVLYHFGELTQTNFDGDIAHLVTGYRQGGYPPLGGIAWLDQLCQTPQKYYDSQSGDSVWVGPFSITNNYITETIPDIPMYSWDVEASTHEMGHNIGSPHTHSCTWPGGAIDDCYPQEGTCVAGPHPAAQTGTIMSYCHLDNTVGIGFSYGFGPLPGNLIRSRVAARQCLSYFRPSNTIMTATTERIANRQCDDGTWTFYFYDNNTADSTDDELLLMIKANGQSIGDVDVTGMTVKMTTQAYGSNVGRSVTAPYGNSANWKEINRTWSIQLPTGVAQPTAAVSIRFPFTSQDVTDIQGSFPEATSSNLSVVSFNNGTATMTSAATADVDFYTNTAGTASTTNWKLGTWGNYNYAEFVSDYGIYGGSIGYKKVTTSINDVRSNESLVIYPNPASNQLNIRTPEGFKENTYAISIIDNLGRTIQATAASVSSRTIALNIEGLSAGVYCIKLNSNGVSYNGFFVKK